MISLYITITHSLVNRRNSLKNSRYIKDTYKFLIKNFSTRINVPFKFTLSVISLTVFHNVMSMDNISTVRKIFVRVDWVLKSFAEVSQRELRAATGLRSVERAARSARRVVLSGTVLLQRPRPVSSWQDYLCSGP